MNEREEKIAAYIAGLMSQEEKETFERILMGDDTLKREVEASRKSLEIARAWVSEEPPGLELVDALKCPTITIKQTGRRAKIVTMFRRAIVIAAIFLLGFLIGKGFPQKGAMEKPISPKTTMVETKPAPAPAPAARETPKIPQEDKSERRITRENGRIIIETTGVNTETRSIWVVDGSIRIAQAK
ncbi:MAG: hypothetical protein NT106_08515 [Candidatus Sumerlaeota bacterium]|nr:hypothetical protein [Candidatus Sumerlaeota bacterium]